MCIVLVLFAAMLFGITQESTQSVYSIQLYSIYCFTGFAVSILTRIMAYEGNYLDGLMVRRESLLSLFRANITSTACCWFSRWFFFSRPLSGADFRPDW